MAEILTAWLNGHAGVDYSLVIDLIVAGRTAWLRHSVAT
jgi:hypothetical protein